MAEYDLTHRLSKFLDRHLVFPLLEFLSARGTYDPKSIQLAKIELLSKTNMVDYAADIYKSVHGTEEPPSDMATRRADVISNLGALQSAAAPVVAFLQDEAAVRALGQDKAANLAHLQAAHGIGPPQIAALYHYAKFQFECGNYGAAAEFLHHYRTLGTDGGRVLAAMWGSLACEVLLQRWDAALASVTRLREVIDADAFAPPALALQRRAWLAHWALFVFFNADGGRAALVDLLLSDRYAAALQLLAPHLLRYLCVAAVVTKRRRATLKDVVRLVEQEAYQYEDAVTSFLRCLLSTHDFEGAQARLAECGPLLAGDFFVASLASEFVEAARLLVFEAYCRVHARIDLALLADRLGLDAEAAEAWVVGLVRGARLDARLDSAAGAVVLGAPFPSARAALVDSVKGLAQRTVTLANAVTGAGAAARSVTMPFWRRSPSSNDGAGPPSAPHPDPAAAQRFFVRAAATPGAKGAPACTKEARPTPVGYDGSTTSTGGGGGGCPVVPSAGGGGGGGGCPVVGAAPPAPPLDPRNLMPADLGTSTSTPARPANPAAAGLSGARAASSIPIPPGADLPQHQGGAGGGTAGTAQAAPSSSSSSATPTKTWTYPSERQFYEAMVRKGWNPAPGDMSAVVAIHNAVNERAWAEVVAWERRAGGGAACGGPRLLRFAGRPGDLSPKARLLNLLGYARPFDRHDWIVDRCGKEVRYVIDFYNGAAGGGTGNGPVAVHLDVRPALDGPAALTARLGRQWEWVASGRWRQV